MCIFFIFPSIFWHYYGYNLPVKEYAESRIAVAIIGIIISIACLPMTFVKKSTSVHQIPHLSKYQNSTFLKYFIICIGVLYLINSLQRLLGGTVNRFSSGQTSILPDNISNLLLYLIPVLLFYLIYFQRQKLLVHSLILYAMPTVLTFTRFSFVYAVVSYLILYQASKNETFTVEIKRKKLIIASGAVFFIFIFYGYMEDVLRSIIVDGSINTEFNYKSIFSKVIFRIDMARNLSALVENYRWQIENSIFVFSTNYLQAIFAGEGNPNYYHIIINGIMKDDWGFQPITRIGEFLVLFWYFGVAVEAAFAYFVISFVSGWWRFKNNRLQMCLYSCSPLLVIMLFWVDQSFLVTAVVVTKIVIILYLLTIITSLRIND